MRTSILDYFDKLAVDMKEIPLPGPIADANADVKAALEELGDAAARGVNHLFHAELQRRHCSGSMSANFVIPFISFTRNNESPPLLTSLVILAHPDDCERIGRSHILKMPDQALFLGPGVLSTTDNSSWRAQHFADGRSTE